MGLVDTLMNLVPLQSGWAQGLVLALAFAGTAIAAKLLLGFVFELIRPMRRYEIFMPAYGLTMSIRVNRRHWERRHDPSAQFYFSNPQYGSILQITLMMAPAEAIETPVPLSVAVTRMRDLKAVDALESSVPVLPLGGEAEGYFFQYTDRKVKPGEWAFVTTGTLWQEHALVHFDLLSHNVHALDSREALDFIRSVSVTRTAPVSPMLQQALEDHMAGRLKEGAAPSREPSPSPDWHRSA